MSRWCSILSNGVMLHRFISEAQLVNPSYVSVWTYPGLCKCSVVWVTDMWRSTEYDFKLSDFESDNLCTMVKVEPYLTNLVIPLSIAVKRWPLPRFTWLPLAKALSSRYACWTSSSVTVILCGQNNSQQYGECQAHSAQVWAWPWEQAHQDNSNNTPQPKC